MNDLAAAFGCSPELVEVLASKRSGPEPKAILKLGPERVKFRPQDSHRITKSDLDNPNQIVTDWLLDGHRATWGEIMAAAGMSPLRPIKEGDE